MFGPVALSDAHSVDQVAPGMPAFVSIEQVNNASFDVSVALPTQDADTTELSGLARLVVATAPMTDGINPFEGLAMDQILALPGVVSVVTSVTPSQAGSTIVSNVAVVALGSFQAFAAACDDAA